MASCSDDDEQAPDAEYEQIVTTADTPLVGVVWFLQKYSISNGEVVEIEPSESYSIGLRELFSERKVIGYIGCHQLLASYAVEGSAITIMVEYIGNNLCVIDNQELTEFDNFYLAALTSIINYSIIGKELTIESSDSTQLVFVKLE